MAHQEDERVDDHQCNPEAVEVIVEPLVQVGQSLQVALHASPVAGAGRHRQGGGGAVDTKPRVRAADVHLQYEAELLTWWRRRNCWIKQINMNLFKVVGAAESNTLSH